MIEWRLQPNYVLILVIAGPLSIIQHVLAFIPNVQLFELDPAVGKHIEYTFGDGIHKMPTALYVMDKVQAQVFYHLSPSEVYSPPQHCLSNWFTYFSIFFSLSSPLCPTFIIDQHRICFPFICS